SCCPRSFRERPWHRQPLAALNGELRGHPRRLPRAEAGRWSLPAPQSNPVIGRAAFGLRLGGGACQQRLKFVLGQGRREGTAGQEAATWLGRGVDDPRQARAVAALLPERQ